MAKPPKEPETEKPPTAGGKGLVHGYPEGHWENDIPEVDPWPERHYSDEDAAEMEAEEKADLEFLNELQRKRAGT
jgi:hypothetical protein